MSPEMSALCDPRTVRTLESAIEALREQLATEPKRCSQAEARADRAESGSRSCAPHPPRRAMASTPR
jgi:hypothetical protein